MDCNSVQHTFLFILLILLVGQGDGRWKKSNREMLQHDIKLLKKMTEKIKEELGAYYEEFSDEPFTDYFFEEIDYLESKINKKIKRITQKNKSKERIKNIHIDQSNIDKQHYIENTLQESKYDSVKNITLLSTDNKNVAWPSFQDILTGMGKKYDWKNDRWIKVKNKTNDKNLHINMPVNSENNVEHLKHNFRYRIVKLNRTKSKRNIVVAVTAVR